MNPFWMNKQQHVNAITEVNLQQLVVMPSVRVGNLSQYFEVLVKYCIFLSTTFI